MVVPPAVLHRCPHCDYSTKWSNNLKRHILTHYEGDLKCSVCQEVLQTSNALKKHFLLKHNQAMGSSCRCVECKESFNCVKTLEGHLTSEHGMTADNWRLQCGQCERTFKQGRALYGHMASRSHKTWSSIPQGFIN